MWVRIQFCSGAGLAFRHKLVESHRVHPVASKLADRCEAIAPAQNIALYRPRASSSAPRSRLWLHLGSLTAMARLDEQNRPDRRLLQSKEQSQAWDHVAKVFGRRPSSIRCISGSGSQTDAFIVKLESFEFICASGVLVGIPPKKPWQK